MATPIPQGAPVPKGGYRDLYPEIEPYDSGYLQVDEIHELYYEQSGNPEGNPVVFK